MLCCSIVEFEVSLFKFKQDGMDFGEKCVPGPWSFVKFYDV